jgi:predicted acetyltransferase
MVVGGSCVEQSYRLAMATTGELDCVTLRPLRADDEAAALAAHAELNDEDVDFLVHLDGAAFADYLETLVRMRLGQQLSPTQVPETFLAAFVGNDLVGRVSIRHALSEQLLRVGGHIGYAVRHQFRRRGFATAILRQSLVVAGEIGIERALLTCDESNLASIATIERCGGVRDRSEESLMQRKLRYWIFTDSLGAGAP